MYILSAKTICLQQIVMILHSLLRVEVATLTDMGWHPFVVLYNEGIIPSTKMCTNDLRVNVVEIEILPSV